MVACGYRLMFLHLVPTKKSKKPNPRNATVVPDGLRAQEERL